MPKVVRRKIDGVTVYRQSPDFENGKGIENAIALHGGKIDDYEEVGITDAEFSVSSTPACRELRAAAYKPLGDQLDDLWHAMDAGILPKVEPFYSDNKAVKVKFAK